MAMSVSTSPGGAAASWRAADIEMTGLSRCRTVGAPYLLNDMMRSFSPHHLPSLTRSVESATGNGGSELDPRRSSIGFGGLTRPPFLVGVALAALLTLGACTSTESTASSTTSSTDPVSTTAEPSATTTSTSTSLATTTTTLPEGDVILAWNAYWSAWVDVRASDDLDRGPLEAVASSAVVDGALTLFERQRSSGLGPVQTEVALHPVVTSTEGDRATLEDCVLLMPSFTDAVGIWYQADLVRTDNSWIVDSIRVPRAGGCVPSAMADAAIAGYQAFYAGWTDFWDPADPDSPIIDQVLTDPQRRIIVDLLVDHESRGAALRGEPTTHPEVIEVRSPTEIVILSCLEPSVDYGLFDVATDERLNDVPAVRDGQRNLESAVMVLEGGLWKVSDLQGQVDFACEFSPTDLGLPSV